MKSSRRRALVAGAGVVLAGAMTAVALVAAGSQQPGEHRTERQTSVAERGRTVMPFDLEQTTHRFTPMATGGVQAVVADRRGDSEQIGLIRDHLRKEAEAFGH
ncbi:hypothetical protein ABZX98_15385 [Streptomyces sp. NPDC002992]|uniref:hypothetical protein n=1 Tax=Streptomyces sp. NPDC002992 TaxID=3154273 RepID=UPI0033B71C00